MDNLKYLFFILPFCVTIVQSARILAIMYAPSFSHQIVYRPLWKELSLKGHQVTLLTTDPMNDPLLTNLTEIDMHSSYKLWDSINFIQNMDVPTWRMWEVLYHFINIIIDEQLNLPEVQNLIQDPEKHFDLVIIEGFHSAHLAFVERFSCPFIHVLSLDASTFVYEEIRSPAHYVAHPDFMLPFVEKLTFAQRLWSTFYSLYFRYLNYHHIIPNQQKLVEKHFGKNYSKIESIYKNYSAYFLNTNNVLHPIRPLLPNVVQIGGKAHFSEQKPLPNDIQNLLDKSNNGVIYFSLGSNAKSKDIPSDVLNLIINVFKQLPYTVLWKFENESLPNKPDNVFISKWYPQQDILRHLNVRLFITQGGLQSAEETLHSGVPLVGIPILADQKSNVRRFASKGLGVFLEYNLISEETFKSAILEVMNNPKYRDTIRKYAEIAVDQQQTGLERAIWWTEYVLRHKGAYHLRNPALDLPWYQYLLLDVIAFCLTITLITAYVLYKALSFLLRISVTLQSKEKQS